MNQRDQHIATAVCDAVVQAVADAFRERFDEMSAEIAHLRVELHQLAKRAPPSEPHPPLPFGKAQNALPRRQLTEVPKIVLPEQRRTRDG